MNRNMIMSSVTMAVKKGRICTSTGSPAATAAGSRSGAPSGITSSAMPAMVRRNVMPAAQSPLRSASVMSPNSMSGASDAFDRSHVPRRGSTNFAVTNVPRIVRKKTDAIMK
jgi:hypothetical protein